MEVISVERLHCGLNAQWPTAMNYCRSHKVAVLYARHQLVISGAFSTHHQIEGYERFVFESIARAMRLHQPFANQSLTISQHGEKAILICIHPLSKAPVLLEWRCISNITGAHERIEHAVHPRHADVRAVKLFL